MSRDSSGGGCGSVIIVLGAIAWIIHWFVTDVPNTSDAGFVDGVVQGSLVAVNGVRHIFGADLGLRDHFAGGAYETGFCVAFLLQVVFYEYLVDVAVGLAIQGEAGKGRHLAISGLLWAAVTGLNMLVSDRWAPPNTPPGKIPPFMGLISGETWHLLMLVGVGIYATLFVLLAATAIIMRVLKR